MGTLTADCPRLDSHCPHKLATSCRLTSTPNCCACADERQHSRTYRVYIDGVGFVQRGTRWQGYCWFCKEFWSNRLAATEPPIEVSDTRIPEVPDQTEFLDRWWEFHQGYRVVKRPDGSDQRMAVIGEPFREVSPGFLPRTLDQLRAGVSNDARRPENRLRRARLASEEEPQERPHQSLEDALNDLMMEEESEDEGINPEMTQEQAPQPSVASPPVPPVPQSREEAAALRRLAELESRAEELGGMASEISRSDARLHRAHDRFVRLFGTREDVQQDDYESPLAAMYSRAFDRYRQAEQRRADGTTAPPLALHELSPQERREVDEQLLWGVLRDSRAMSDFLGEHEEGIVWAYDPADAPTATSPTNNTNDDDDEDDDEDNDVNNYNETTNANRSHLVQLSRESLGRRRRAAAATNSIQPRAREGAREGARPPWPGLNELLHELEEPSDPMLSNWRNIHRNLHAFAQQQRPVVSPPTHTLDNQPDRPEPLTDEDMTRLIACQVCYQQLADIVVLPCGHTVMCEWCADVVIPVKHSHIPAAPSNCPMCRRRVKQRFKVYYS